MKPILRRMLSGMLSVVTTISAIPIVSAHADESTEPYPYTMFAASGDEGAITVNAGNFCVNGNVATNGTIVSDGNMNVNGTKTEYANMTLSLYNYLGSGKYENIYNWVPIIDQWWVTGFAPEYSEPDPEIMISVASINLSEHEEFFNSILEADEIDDYYDELKRDHLIFDKITKTVWVQWYNESVA